MASCGRQAKEKEVKPRHAAALALVGWYLIIPSSMLPTATAHKEPFRRWQIVRGFDSADDCEDFRSDFFERSRQRHGLNVLEPAYRDYMFVECIATDDPRLKGD
jgi:hypothetical protein